LREAVSEGITDKTSSSSKQKKGKTSGGDEEGVKSELSCSPLAKQRGSS